MHLLTNYNANDMAMYSVSKYSIQVCVFLLKNSADHNKISYEAIQTGWSYSSLNNH